MPSATLDHPQLGCLHFIGGEGLWIGKTARGDEFCIQADFFDDHPDPECEALAVRELSDFEGLLARIEAFLAIAREPYLDQWASRRWEVNSMVFSREDDRPTFVAKFLLERDDYTTWLVRVENGVPVALSRR